MSTKGTYNKPFRTVVEEKFESLDLDKNGYVSLKEMLHQADVLEEMCHASPKKVKPFRDSMRLFAEGIGFTPGKELAKEEFVDAVIRFAAVEQEKKRSGKETLYDRIHNAMFDIIDTNDDGTLSLDEIKVMMKVFHRVEDPGAAEVFFTLADTNENGKVEREEFINLKFDLMFNPDNT